MSGAPVFSTITDARGPLIVCVVGGEEGRARIFSKGEEDARQRAEKMARDKLKAKRA